MQLPDWNKIGSSDLVTHSFAVTENLVQHHVVLLGIFIELLTEQRAMNERGRHRTASMIITSLVDF